MLTSDELTRYGRQIICAGLGAAGQEKLKKSHVVVVGVGGLGCPASLYLAAAGVGQLTIIDCDVVELSNLNRQVLYTVGDIGEEKAVAAARRLAHLNPSVAVTPRTVRVTDDNARDLVFGADVVVDGMDNFETRLVVNRACLAERVPFVHAGVRGFLGELTTVIPGRTPCLACFAPAGAEKKSGPLPVFGFTPGVLAALQAAEVVKLIAGVGGVLAGEVLYVDLEKMRFSRVALRRRPDCPACGDITA